MSRKRIAFGWYGGKYSHLSWLLPQLPKCGHYVEPFGGSAAVLLNRQPSGLETYNDLDGEVCNFFRVLRDTPSELVRQIGLTPVSREEYRIALTTNGADPLERARRFYVRARQTRAGLAQTASIGRWANCKSISRQNMSAVVSRWLGGVVALPDIAQRLLRVQIENRPALELIPLYDSPQTLFYCDPPYLHSTRGSKADYAHELDSDQHRALCVALNFCAGKVAVSGYDHPQMDEMLPAPHWRKIRAEVKTIHSNHKSTRQEVLWTNYPPIAGSQRELDFIA